MIEREKSFTTKKIPVSVLKKPLKQSVNYSVPRKQFLVKIFSRLWETCRRALLFRSENINTTGWHVPKYGLFFLSVELNCEPENRMRANGLPSVSNSFFSRNIVQRVARRHRFNNNILLHHRPLYAQRTNYCIK